MREDKITRQLQGSVTSAMTDMNVRTVGAQEGEPSESRGLGGCQTEVRLG